MGIWNPPALNAERVSKGGHSCHRASTRPQTGLLSTGGISSARVGSHHFSTKNLFSRRQRARFFGWKNRLPNSRRAVLIDPLLRLRREVAPPVEIHSCEAHQE